MAKGHNPRIKEPDIAYGFTIYTRSEKFSLDLSEIDAHTFKIVEIIEQEISNVRQKNMQKNFNNVGDNF